MAPTVSVVIVTYNKADTIGPAIESVLRQTYRDLEIIVVDDGSTDDTAAAVETFGNRIRLVCKDNGGTASARNLGVSQAQGQYVAFLDGDDLWLPHKLEIQLAVLQHEPGVDSVQCSAYCVDNQLDVLEVRPCYPAKDSLLNFLLFRNMPAFCSALVVRRDFIESLGGFATDLEILSDWDMACRLAHKGTLRSVFDFLVLYRQYPGNQSRNVGIHIECGFRSLGRLFSDPTLDPAIRVQETRIWARFYAMLAGGYFRSREWKQGLQWGWRALRTSPRVGAYFAGMPVRHLRRAYDLQRKISFAGELPFALNLAGN